MLDGTGLIQPKELKITDRNGNEKTFVLSIIPATYAREIVAQYPTSALPKVGDYSVNQEMMLKLMSYVGVVTLDKKIMRLTTRELIDNHADFITLAKLEKEMFVYNYGFFLIDDLSDLKERFKRILTTFLTQILTDSLQQSSQLGLQPSMNSAQSTD